MKPLKILILDIHPSAGLGCILNRILIDAACGVVIDHRTCRTKAARQLSVPFSSGGKAGTDAIDVVFLVSAQENRSDVSHIISTVVKEKAPIPVVLVSDENDPAAAIESLKLGAADYVAVLLARDYPNVDFIIPL